MIKIVILDGETLNPNDLDWREISALGDTTIYVQTPPEKVIERSKDADVLIINKILITDAILQQLPKLRYIGIICYWL